LWISLDDIAVMYANKAYLVFELQSVRATHDNVLELKWIYFTSLFLVVRVLFPDRSISAVPLKNA
jgi:hypothetical protein